MGDLEAKNLMQKDLIASALANDPRIAQAKQLLIEAARDHRQKIKGIQPPKVHLTQTYKEALAQFSQYRGAKLYFPYLGSGMGNGALVELLDGSVKYDFICGIGPHYWGHSHEDLLTSSVDAALSDIVMQGNLQQNVDSYELTELLIQASKMDHCFLSSSGVMANENALKIAFQKKFPASRILAFEHCFLGRTLAASQVTDKPSFREGLPLNYHIDYVPYYNPAKPEESTEEALKILKNHIARYPKQHAVMCFELVQGEGGFYAGTKEFFKVLMQVLKDHDIAILDDEIQTFGRTSELFAYQHFELEEYVDLVSIGKLSQVCATLYKKEFTPRAGLLSQTFIGSTAAIKAGITIINHLIKGNYFGHAGKIMQMHEYIVKKLKEVHERNPGLLQGPFGLGSMIAFTPYDGDAKHAAEFIQNLFEAGVIGFIAGSNPTRVRFLIPMGAITTQDIDQAIKICEDTLIKTRVPVINI